ncbi:hypothetical protein OKW45_002282 [Paraburkholderia sp. WSM4175]|uniref:hypothetical protein n=1 Tax=Paraburkholderia sp. WSM4175 TaxID=2991072 RepID=UPI003D1A1C51
MEQRQGYVDVVNIGRRSNDGRCRKRFIQRISKPDVSGVARFAVAVSNAGSTNALEPPAPGAKRLPSSFAHATTSTERHFLSLQSSLGVAFPTE